MTCDYSYIYPQMEAETRLQSSVGRRLDKILGSSCYDHAFVLPSKDLWKDGKCFGGIVTHDGILLKHQHGTKERDVTNMSLILRLSKWTSEP